jgi:hypothetical protein
MAAHRQRLNDMSTGRSGSKNEYWRWGMPGKHTRNDLKDFLRKRAFHHKQSEKLPRLKVLAERCDRGHLSYEAYNVAQLRQFVEDRGLKMKSPSKANKKQLVQRLENAEKLSDTFEDKREFPRFLELPPELILLQRTKGGPAALLSTTNLQVFSRAAGGNFGTILRTRHFQHFDDAVPSEHWRRCCQSPKQTFP